MRPTFLGFEAAKTGVFASQKALDIVGHNLSNIHTEGYTRQRVEQTAQFVDGSKQRLKPDLVGLAGMGTYIEGVAQLRNERLDNSYRKESACAGYYDQQSTMLSDIENILNELEVGEEGNGYGLAFAIKDMFSALEDFAYNSTSEADANVFANSVLNVTQTLNRASANLTKCADQHKEELQINVDKVNSMFEDLAALNKSIRATMVTNQYTDQFGPNELKDQRNLILDKLSEYGTLRVEDQPDGTITVEFNGHKCVWDTECDKINYRENRDGTVQLNWKTDGTYATKDTGALKAAVDILNGRGSGVRSNTESTANGFLYYQDKLDAFAEQLAYVLNNTIPETVDASGNPVPEKFDDISGTYYPDPNGTVRYKKLVGEAEETDDGFEVNPEKLVSAEKINITKELNTDSSYLIDKNNSANNAYLLELVNKLTKDNHSFHLGEGCEGDTFTGTFQEFVADYTGTLGSELTYVEGRYENSLAILNEIQDSRDEISGVSESEETVNMMTYNRAYQAAARMMTIMDGLLDVIINRTAV